MAVFKRLATVICGLGIVAMVGVAGFVAIQNTAAPQQEKLSPLVVLDGAPDGCRPVAPGAVTSMCIEDQTSVEVAAPVIDGRTAASGCRPVAPGAYTQICEHAAPDRPRAPDSEPGPECRPVAPGAYTSICVRP